MSLNINPVYAKQYIRYADTYQAATLNQAGTADVELGEYRAVAYATYAGANKCCAPGDLTSFSGAILGINQAYIPTVTAQPNTARQASVATSGMLIVEVAPTAGSFTLNTQLRVDSAGRAINTGGTLATLDGTTPLVREVVEIGGRKLAVVSFA